MKVCVLTMKVCVHHEHHESLCISHKKSVCTIKCDIPLCVVPTPCYRRVQLHGFSCSSSQPIAGMHLKVWPKRGRERLTNMARALFFSNMTTIVQTGPRARTQNHALIEKERIPVIESISRKVHHMQTCC